MPAVAAGGAPEAGDGRPVAIAVVRAPSVVSTDAVTTRAAASSGTDRAGHRDDRSNGECGVEGRPGSEA